MTSEKVQNIFNPDLKAIKAHLDFLFSGIDMAHADGFIEISHLTGSKYFPVKDTQSAANQAYEWNKDGKNIYTTASILVPDVIERVKLRQGRARGEDFYAACAVWVDLDDIKNLDLLKEAYKDAQPNYYVVTGRTPNLRSHLWWSLESVCADKSILENINKGLIKALGGDKGTHNCTRLMRIAGGVAWPTKDGRVTEFVESGITQWFPPLSIERLSEVYKFEDLKAEYKPEKPEHKMNFSQNDGWSENDVLNMLNHISPDSQYFDWLSVGMALKDRGMPFSMYDTWSSKGSSYPGSKELRDKWDSFKGKGVTIGTLYYHAKNGGFNPADYKPKSSGFSGFKSSETKDEFDPETGEFKKSEATIKYTLFKDIKASLKANDFVQGMLGRNQISVIYGRSNCGKTFFMTDLAFHVAMGKPWRGRRVQQGGVIYCALEGSYGLKNRVEAFRMHNEITSDMPFTMIYTHIDFLNPEGNISEFANVIIDEIEAQSQKTQLIVIDTLAVATAGGDENSGQDMSMIIKHAHLIRQRTGAHIAFIHHSGKDETKGARGHSSLRAAVDTEIEISRGETETYSTIKTVKQREMEMADDMHFTLRKVTLGMNEYDEEVASCVVSPLDASAITEKKGAPLTPAQKFVFDAIMDEMEVSGKVVTIHKNMPDQKTITYAALAERLEFKGYRNIIIEDEDDDLTKKRVKSSTQAARIALKAKGKINFNGNLIWVTE